eukprot:Partr_v1_DN27569_c0_g1_i2_m30385 putative TatD DNase domain containing
MFRGMYRGKLAHIDDSAIVINRSVEAGVTNWLLTGTCLETSRQCILLASDITRNFPQLHCRSTVGCHPTESARFEPNPHMYVEELRQLVISNRSTVAAVGELGLDYDRLEFCPAHTQREFFRLQLRSLNDLNLPFFLHFRGEACIDDFCDIINENPPAAGGVVHSFTGTEDEMTRILSMGLDIGINGCSLRTDQG